MSFTDIMRRILPNVSINGTDFVSYVNGSGNVLDYDRLTRSDYDDISPTNLPGSPTTYRMENGRRTIHGGADIYYYQDNNGTPVWIGSGTPPNSNHPTVHAPVHGWVIFVQKDLLLDP